MRTDGPVMDHSSLDERLSSTDSDCTLSVIYFNLDFFFSFGWRDRDHPKVAVVVGRQHGKGLG